ncbi:hypothetical protein GUJ93_ZPchr0014g47537 [Zizania palustris]|uniref:Uncharacterized protein n=1 Tax=Zizania palustris TaxID=103762 RepID=A0A8J5TH51_ZIZPA|nr:hypothetical protein GUJ93_ZPchr0014g47537 [Zizania palustris]
MFLKSYPTGKCVRPPAVWPRPRGLAGAWRRPSPALGVTPRQRSTPSRAPPALAATASYSHHRDEAASVVTSLRPASVPIQSHCRPSLALGVAPCRCSAPPLSPALGAVSHAASSGRRRLLLPPPRRGRVRRDEPPAGLCADPISLSHLLFTPFHG